MSIQDIIEQHIQHMEDALAQLSKYQNISFEDFEKDLSLVWIVERGLEILIQNLLDIGGHILEDFVQFIKHIRSYQESVSISRK